MIDVATFKSRVSSKLHGTTLAKLTSNFYDVLHEAAGNMQLQVKPPSVIRSASIESAIYDKLYNYAVASDLDPDSVIDIRPIGERSTGDDIEGTFGKAFDIKKKENTFAIEYVNGVRTLRLSKSLTARTVLATLDSLTSDGTITATGDATDLAVDYLDRISGSASLSMGLSGVTGVGGVTLNLSTAIDLSLIENLGALFEWIKFPDTSRLTSVTLKWGSSSSAYWSKVVTAAHDRTFAQGNAAWILLTNPWVSATTTGVPDSTAIDYLDISFTYTTGTALSGVKLDSITSALGEVWESVYYSNRYFTDSAGTTWKEIPTQTTDLIRLDADGINLLLYEVMIILGQEVKGKNQGADNGYFYTALHGRFGSRGIEIAPGAYELFNQKYPSQVVVRSDDYYEFGDLDGH